MRLCNVLITYILFISLSLSFYHCHGHEHHNHVDPVPNKLAESAVTVDPLAKPLETTNFHDHHHHDDGHQHDTIEARLKAKHNLRQSVHQHVEDDKQESEQEYINRLNSALEDDEVEHHFQYVAPPIADTNNNNTTSIQNQTKEDIQVPIHTQNETLSSTATSIQTPPEQEKKINENLSSNVVDSSKSISTQDEKSNVKIISQENQQPINAQNIIKEDILFVQKETVEQQQQQQPVEQDNNSSSSDQQSSVVNTTVEQPQQNQTSSNSNITSEKLQQTAPVDVKSKQQDIKVETISTTPTPVINPESTKILDDTEIDEQPVKVMDSVTTLQTPTISPDQTMTLDRKIDQQPVETVKVVDPVTISTPSIQTEQQNLSSVQENQAAPTVDTLKLTETVSAEIKSETVTSNTESAPTLAQTAAPPTRVLRSATSRLQHRAQQRQRELREKEQASEQVPTIDDQTAETTLSPIEQSVEEHKPITTTISPPIQEQFVEPTPVTLQQEESIVETPQNPVVQQQESSVEIPQASTSQSTESTIETTPVPTVEIQEPIVEPILSLTIDDNQTNETESLLPNEQIPVVDLPRQVHVHDPQQVLDELKNETIQTENSSLEQEIANNTTVDSFLTNDQTRHLPRVLENEQTDSTIDSNIPILTTTVQTIETSSLSSETHNIHSIPADTKSEETNHSLSYKTNTSEQIFSTKNRQVCWRLVKPLDSSFELIENQTLRFADLLPEFLQTILFGELDNREIRVNTIWFGSICGSCFFFSLIFLSMAAKRLKQNKHEKEIRARCQQLQQYNNQLELERATFERENQKLFDEIEELKNQPLRDTDEEMYQLRENYDRIVAEWKNFRVEYDNLQRDNDHKQSLIQKHHFDLQKQVENVAYLNDEILRQKQELEKERETIVRLQTNDLSLERFEQLQQIINDLKSENTQLKQDRFAQTDELQQIQERTNQLDIDNNELTIKLKQLKDLLEQRDQMIVKLKENIKNNDEDNENRSEEDVNENEIETNGETNEEQQRDLFSTIDSDVQKANQHMRNLHAEIEDKTRRLKELDTLLNQEKDRCRELDTKLKVILELRERDAHLHIRQLGQSDAELRKARTDTERVRILQQQLELKQKQLDDVQRELTNEQTKFSEECSKLQHETHEKWMEVKRLTRELDGAKKECEGLRRQITKYAQNDRSSQEKTMHKPIAHHLNNTGRLSSEPETNGSSPTTLPYQQGDNFRPIDHERNDSGAASPSDMMRIRPPMFGIPRPPFFPPPFMPPPNPFLLAPRFPMPPGGPHGMISPIPHLMTNGSAGGSDSNSFEIVDSTNITPNSTSYDVHVNGSATSPIPDDEQQVTTKVKKPKKSLKKKTKTSATTTVSGTKEDV